MTRSSIFCLLVIWLAQIGSSQSSLLLEDNFNKAVSHYEKAEYALAILYFERAKRLDPNNSIIQQNLELAEEAAGVDNSSLSTYPILEYVSTFVGMFSYLGWLVLAGIIMLLYAVIKNIFKQASRYLQMAYVSMVLICMICAVSSYWRLYDTDISIVVESNTRIWQAPDTLSQVKETLLPGTKVKQIDKLTNWKKVELPDKSQGWVEVKCVTTI